MKNMELTHRVVECLVKAGVREFCICAGARNSPFVELFSQNPHLKVFHFFEERSASFFALGRIVATRHPVAVITTSGTAVAECLPAAVEATYSSLPLMIVTADRPKRYRGSGAPQSIEQVGLFSYYIEACFDLDESNSHVSVNGLSWKKPIHINVCFEEPLLDAEVQQVVLPEREIRTALPESIPMQMVDDLDQFLGNHRPVVLLSTIPEKHRESVIHFLSRLGAPIYAEGISGLRGHPQLQQFEIKCGERMLYKLIDEGYCDSVLRMGGVPTVRFWRDLEDRRAHLPVFSISYNHFTGLSREIPHYEDLGDLSLITVPKQKNLPIEIKKYDEKMAETARKLFAQYPAAEPSIVHFLSRQLKNSHVYLGNSLPIREWDFAADYEGAPLRVAASRGANGIDGQISTFLGWCRGQSENWCIVGDLTALYDLSSLWISPQMSASKARIVVLNNKGGMIFKKMFGKDIYYNRHNIGFSHWAAQWGWGYSQIDKWDPNLQMQDRHIIEISVSDEQTEAFWNSWNSSWI